MRSASTARASRVVAGVAAVVGLGWGPVAAPALAEGPETPTAPAAPAAPAAELAFARTAPIDGVRPGDATEVSFSVINRGDGPATRVALFLTGSQGLSFAEKYSNCVYEDSPAQDEGPAQTNATCDIEQTLEPGVVYVPEKPLGVTVLDRALYERLSLVLQEDSIAFPEGTQHGGGADPVLRLVPRQPPGDPGAVYGYERLDVGITARNTADFALTGARLQGRAGETVTAEVTFANKGPAWVANDVGSPIGVFDVRVPTGTTVVGAPDFCLPLGPDDSTVNKADKAARVSSYRCTTPYVYVDENSERPYPFRLRIDKVVKNATGTVTFVKGDHRWGTLPFDQNRANNTAEIVVNPSSGGAGTGGASAGGASAGGASAGGTDTGGTGTGGADGGSGTAGGGTQSGGAQGGTVQGTGTQGAGTEDGALADTGTGIGPLIGGTAAALLMAGGGFLISAQRQPRRVPVDRARGGRSPRAPR
ncbi:hypothetical protein ACFYYH_27585 [Streptomyces sp. NPDC002018]|uniref:hypothetical protein n=1 Tax=Streptomyces sp. NPDC002018 TaxID=3364629 RepID=UPI0036C84712